MNWSKLKYTILVFTGSFFVAHTQGYLLESDTLGVALLMKMADESSDMGEFEKSIELIDQAIEIYSEFDLWKDAIHCEVKISKIADNFESADPKIKHSNNALALAKKYLSQEDLLLASAYRQKAEALMWIEELDSSNYFLNKALPIFKSKGEWEEFGWTRILIAVNFLNNYQLDSSEVHLNHLSDWLKNASLSKTHFDEMQSTMFELRGVIYDFQGDYDKALLNLEEALTINLENRNKSKLDSSFVSNQFNSLGTIYLNKGDYLRANDNFLQAVHFDQNAMMDANLLNNIGVQYFKQGKYQEAIDYLKKSKQVSSRLIDMESFESSTNSKYLTESLNRLCSCYRALGKYNIAIQHCKVAIDRSKGFKNYATWTIMGNIYHDIGQAENAIMYLEKAHLDLSINGASAEDKLLIQSKIYLSLGNSELLNQNPDRALLYFQKSLVKNHKDFRDSLQIDSNPNLEGVIEPVYFLKAIRAKASTQASFFDDHSSAIKALNSYQLAVQWIDNLKMSYVLDDSQIDWNTEFKPIYEEAIDVAYRIYQNTGESEYLEMAFAFSEKSRSSILLEQLKCKEGKHLANIADSLLQKGRHLNLDIVFYQKKVEEALAKKDSSKLKLYQGYLSKSRLNLASLEEKLEKDYPKFYKMKYETKDISISQIQENLLSAKSALIEFFIGDSVDYVFVITKGSATMIELEGQEDTNFLIAEFVRQMYDLDGFRQNARSAFANYNVSSYIVYSRFLAKPLAMISKDVDHLIVIPDGILNAVPFEALTEEISKDKTIDFAKLPYLIYKYRLQYSYSAQLLFENKLRSKKLASNTSCLGFAPTYETDQYVSLEGSFDQLRNSSQNLSGTTYEISQISRFVDGKYHVGEKATEERFKSESENYGILHLAMHGTVDLDNSNYNHLKFSNLIEDETEDNLLHQYEIVNLDLNAQLVVLSACETGIGKYEKGEGVFSMARSFMQAGVPSIVMSLWKVSDASTSQLMPEFYQNLKENQSKVKAFHQAKLNYLKSADLEMRHPFYWSAFVLIGDGAVLKASSSNLICFAFAGFVLVLLGWLVWKKL